MQATDIALANPNADFSAPWKFSDVLLVVEDQKFHVHRSTLAYWSPVFEKMFASEFKEKSNDEVPLPGKKASEIKHLLHMMYPSLEEKPVTASNCYFLFELAHEYQIESIAQKCEALMVTMVKGRTENDVLSMLIYGQNYKLKNLISTCIYEARRLSLKELKEHKKRDEIEPENYLQIAEGIIQRLEEKCKVVKEGSLKSLEKVSRSLYIHGTIKGTMSSSYGGEPTEKILGRLRGDFRKVNITCENLGSVAEEIMGLKKVMDSLPDIPVLHYG